MVFSRGTHQQFYAWYSFSFPFIVDACDVYGPLAKISLIIALEIAWSAGKPHSAIQGHLLNAAHLLILFGLLLKENTYKKLKVN